jgi:hypothetical protein
MAFHGKGFRTVRLETRRNVVVAHEARVRTSFRERRTSRYARTRRVTTRPSEGQEIIRNHSPAPYALAL